jgi:hypothetical protein
MRMFEISVLVLALACIGGAIYGGIWSSSYRSYHYKGSVMTNWDTASEIANAHPGSVTVVEKGSDGYFVAYEFSSTRNGLFGLVSKEDTALEKLVMLMTIGWPSILALGCVAFVFAERPK